jgi:tRNA(fMet)-specific endonuclease VapC
VRLALDTNRYTDLCRGNTPAVDTIEAAGEVWVPFVVLGELRAGFAVGSQGPRNEAILRRFLIKPGVDVLYADEQTTHHYASVYHQLRKQGTPMPTNDMWIAALVLQHSLILYDRDAHFDALPQLTRV